MEKQSYIHEYYVCPQMEIPPVVIEDGMNAPQLPPERMRILD